MFLLKQGRTVLVLVTIFGILLPDLYIQPAQAEGEVLLEAQPKAQLELQAESQPDATAQRVQFNTLKCHTCEPCEGRTCLGVVRQCYHPLFDHCVWGETEYKDGRKTSFRGCAAAFHVNHYSCDKFTPMISAPDEKVRMCSCKGDLCNDKPASGTSSSAQLLLVAVSVFGCLMMK